MKKNIHPKSYPTCYEDITTGKKFFTFSTLKSKNIININNIIYQYYKCELTSDSHPIYTGEKRFVDSEGRIEKFNKKFKRGLK